MDPSTPYLESTANSMLDDFSVSNKAYPTAGGATQRVVGERAAAQVIAP
jgi:hypothetical protein